MTFLAALDRRTTQFQRRFANLVNPSPHSYDFPIFEARIAERHRRWHSEAEAHFARELSGKVEGETYMKSLGHPVPEIYGRFPTLHHLPDLRDLPTNVVLKPELGHSSYGVFLMKDGVNQFDGRRLSRSDIIAAAGSHADTPYMAEELLQDFDGRPGTPRDFKFFCFGPEIVAVHVFERNSVVEGWRNRHWYRTADWKPLKIRLRWDFWPERSHIEKPPFWDDMVRIVADVGGRLNLFMRIDMYATTRGPVFGEFTPFPCMGRNFTPRANAWLGKRWIGDEGCAPQAAEPATPVAA